AADINRDGHLDIVSTGGVALGNGDGTFQTGIGFPAGGGGQAVRVADFNNDGKVDALTSDYGQDRVNLMLGRGDGTFDRPLRYQALWANDPVIGDFNRDGWIDVAASYGVADGVTVLLNRGCRP